MADNKYKNIKEDNNEMANDIFEENNIKKEVEYFNYNNNQINNEYFFNERNNFDDITQFDMINNQNKFFNSNINFSNKFPLYTENYDENKNYNYEKIQGKKKIKLEYIKRKPKRGVTFSKRKKGIMKKAFELGVLTGSEILLIVANETGHVYTYSTPKLKPVLERQESFIKNCLGAKQIKNNQSFENDNEINENM